MSRGWGVRAGALAAVALTAACVVTGGAGRDFDPRRFAETGWVRAPAPIVLQRAANDCGAAAVAMILGRWDSPVSADEVARRRALPDKGYRASDLRALLRDAGLQAFIIGGRVADLVHELRATRPVIVGTTKRVGRREVLQHFEVVVGWHSNPGRIVTIDPAHGYRVYQVDDFVAEWRGARNTAVITLPPGRETSAAR